jgi:hypothetical protein
MKEENLSRKFMEAIKGGLVAVVEGIGKAYDLAQSSPTINDMANHGRTELAAALFNGSNAYVMYQRGSHDQPSPDVREPEMVQSRGLHQ